MLLHPSPFLMTQDSSRIESARMYCPRFGRRAILLAFLVALSEHLSSQVPRPSMPSPSHLFESALSYILITLHVALVSLAPRSSCAIPSSPALVFAWCYRVPRPVEFQKFALHSSPPCQTATGPTIVELGGGSDDCSTLDATNPRATRTRSWAPNAMSSALLRVVAEHQVRGR